MTEQAFVIEIDLNAVDANGEVIVHEDAIISPTLRRFTRPSVGEHVYVRDEWHNHYLASVSRVEDDGWMDLIVKLSEPFLMPARPPKFRQPPAVGSEPLLGSYTSAATAP